MWKGGIRKQLKGNAEEKRKKHGRNAEEILKKGKIMRKKCKRYTKIREDNAEEMRKEG